MLQSFLIAKDKNGKQTSMISDIWVTNLLTDSGNFFVIIEVARARWQIENYSFTVVMLKGNLLVFTF